jgi:heptosyltransferase-2
VKLLIEPPTWLGDAVMASGAIDKLLKVLNPDECILFGSFAATEVLKTNPKINKVIVDNRKNRLKEIFTLPKVDLVVSFRRSFYSKLLKFRSKNAFFFSHLKGHMVTQYNDYINNILYDLREGFSPTEIFAPKLYFKPIQYKKLTLGINPGATYGSAKRWYPEEFAKVANELGKKYDVIIFGGPGEEEIANDIEKNLTIKNYKNLCGKLSIKELAEHIGGLDLFITNDSGPMHIAAAFQVSVVAIFGPTKYDETSPFNTKYKIVTKDLECAPCMKRECPLKHHNCMKLITAKDVIKAAEEL